MASICWFDPAFTSAAASRRIYSPLSSSGCIRKVLTRSLQLQRALTPSSAIVPRRVSASSVVAQGVSNEGMERRGQHDLLIVGPGVLGRLVAKEWKKEFAETCLVGQTMTADYHEELVKIGITPVLRGTELIPKFPYVIFCAPPSRTSDYPGEVRLALSKWSGEGAFLFTSSSAPYDCDDNGTCDEDSPVVPIGSSPKTDKLLKAEKIVVEAGACVLRLAGLYISLLDFIG